MGDDYFMECEYCNNKIEDDEEYVSFHSKCYDKFKHRKPQGGRM